METTPSIRSNPVRSHRRTEYQLDRCVILKMDYRYHRDLYRTTAELHQLEAEGTETPASILSRENILYTSQLEHRYSAIAGACMVWMKNARATNVNKATMKKVQERFDAAMNHVGAHLYTQLIYNALCENSVKGKRDCKCKCKCHL